MSVYTRTFVALGAGSRKVMVLSAFTSGERTLVTTLASTPGPRPRPVGPLPPGGLLTIWACTEAATSVARAVAGSTRRILSMMSSSPIPRRSVRRTAHACRVPAFEARAAVVVEVVVEDAAHVHLEAVEQYAHGDSIVDLLTVRAEVCTPW